LKYVFMNCCADIEVGLISQQASHYSKEHLTNILVCGFQLEPHRTGTAHLNVILSDDGGTDYDGVDSSGKRTCQ